MYSHKSLPLNFIFILIFFTYVTFLALFSSSELPTNTNHGNFMPYLAAKPITEDGFYMLTVAWNFGQGKGFEYNQGLKTSGVQPLATVVYGILAFISNQLGIDKKDFPRVIILFSALVLFIFTMVLKNTMLKFFSGFDKDVVFFLCLLLGMLNFDLFISFTNGLETGIYLLMVLISISIYWKILNVQNIKVDISAGIIFGLTSLARFDFIIISTSLLLLALFFSKVKFKAVFIILTLQFLIIFPWLFYTYGLTGSIIQSSAISQISYISIGTFADRLYSMLLAIFQILTLNINTGTKDNVLVLIGIPVSAILLILFFKYKRIYAHHHFFYLSLIFTFLIFTVVYILSVNSIYFYSRYLLPITAIVLLLIIPIIYSWSKDLSNKQQFYLGSFFLLVFLIHSYLYFHTGKLGGPTSLRPDYISQNFESTELVGSFQSGVLGYYFENVINLDGKINHIALNYSRNNKLNRYIDSAGINVLIEWKEVFPIGDKFEFYNNWEKISDNIGDNRAICFKRRIKIF